MRRYILVMVLVTVAAVSAYLTLMLTLPNRISAEYWLREVIIVKQDIARSQKSPRIVLLGGSNILFGLDAAMMEKELGLPVVNFGLHGGMQLDRILQLGGDPTGSGDIILLAPEHEFFGCKERWSPWQVRSAITWDRDEFDQRSFADRAMAALSPGGRGLFYETVSDAVGRHVWPERYAQRNDAMVPAETVLARFHSGERQTSDFAYSAYNLDRHGTMKHLAAARVTEAANTGLEAATVCGPTLDRYERFVSDMRAKDVKVVFAYPPYLIEGEPADGWKEADLRVATQIRSIGSEMIQPRDEVFYPREAFFDVNGHLNEKARTHRTTVLIGHLLRLGILQNGEQASGSARPHDSPERQDLPPAAGAETVGQSVLH